MSRKIPRWVVHVTVWIVLTALSLATSYVLPEEFRNLMLWLNIVCAICSISLFYLNFSFLVEKYWTKKRYWGFILINLAALAVCAVILYETTSLEYDKFWHFSDAPESFQWLFPAIIAISYMPSGMFVIVISSFFKTSSFWNQSQTRLRELENEHIKAELEGLKSQINPHFLFNSLNAVYALIPMDQDKAQEATHALSNLLRYVLNEKNEEMVPLDDELKFTQDYIDLMSMRFSSDMLSLKVEMPDKAEGYRIAPMLFMTLIENAFKHGISNTSPSFILVLMHIADGRIYATISNSLFPKNENDRREGGIGLDNLSKRLELIYGNEASMVVTQEDGAYTTKLEIPLRK